MVGDAVDGWHLMAVLDTIAVFERWDDVDGQIAFAPFNGSAATVLTKASEPAAADPRSLYFGRTLERYRCRRGRARQALLTGDDDPDYEVAGCLAPLTNTAQFTFVGNAATDDKIVIDAAGRSPNFDPAVVEPGIRAHRDPRDMRHGLAGGWLPVVRFVYVDGLTTGGSTWASRHRMHHIHIRSLPYGTG